MCGRFSLTTEPSKLAEHFDLPTLPNLTPRYNIAPTQDIAVIRNGESGNKDLAMLHWGLVPHWSKGPDSRYSMINARAETIAEKPSFREAFRKRRCLIPADGFYEWQPSKDGKQPFRITLPNEEPFAFAGLWESWRGEDGTEINSCTIIVTEANKQVRTIHDRMPVILSPKHYEVWLNHTDEPAKLLGLLKPYEGNLTTHKVSRHVNNPANDDEICIRPIDED